MNAPTNSFPSSFLSELKSSLTPQFSKAALVLLGDFNYPDIDCDSLLSTNYSSSCFSHLCLDFNLTQLINQPARITDLCCNVLDLCLSSGPSMIHSLTYLPGLGNRLVLNFSLPLPNRCQLSKSKIQIRDYRNADYATVNTELSSDYRTFRSSHLTHSPVDNWFLLKGKLTSLADRHIPLITINSDSSSPWYTETLKRLSNIKKWLYRNAKHTHTSGSLKKYDACSSTYKRELDVAKSKFFYF